MNFFDHFFISFIIGLISLLLLLFAFSRKPEEFYKSAWDTPDVSGISFWIALIGKGFHKLFKCVFPNKHLVALKIFCFLFGLFFLVIAIENWFVDISYFQMPKNRV